jgi:hypothetical protein
VSLLHEPRRIEQRPVTSPARTYNGSDIEPDSRLNVSWWLQGVPPPYQIVVVIHIHVLDVHNAWRTSRDL